MKKLLKKSLLFCIGWFCKLASVVWPYSRAMHFRSFIKKLHTRWISYEFKELGEFSIIDYPINLQGGKYILIGSKVVIEKGGILNAWDKYGKDNFIPQISIGNHTLIGEGFHITATNKIIIGNDVLIGKRVTITDNGHGKAEADLLDLPPIDRTLYSKGPVIIENGVWIGDKVTILPNVKIGRNAIIGANSLITKDIPPNCVAGGVPAAVIKRMR
jgi:acetyltransferase-like isoleucine patch superfamily enzyme